MAEKLYVTFTTKPLSVASSEGLPAVSAPINLVDLENAKLVSLVEAAVKALEVSDAAA